MNIVNKYLGLRLFLNRVSAANSSGFRLELSSTALFWAVSFSDLIVVVKPWQTSALRAVDS